MIRNIRPTIADDHPMFHKRLQGILSAELEFDVVREASIGNATMQFVAQRNFGADPSYVAY